MKERTYIFHEDPGHGWLEVPVEDICELGIVTDISRYSYQRGQIAYLEEDCDAPRFLEALKARGIPFKLTENVYPRSLAPIRNYGMFIG